MAAISLFGDTNMAAVTSCEIQELLAAIGHFAKYHLRGQTRSIMVFSEVAYDIYRGYYMAAPLQVLKNI